MVQKIMVDLTVDDTSDSMKQLNHCVFYHDVIFKMHHQHMSETQGIMRV